MREVKDEEPGGLGRRNATDDDSRRAFRNVHVERERNSGTAERDIGKEVEVRMGMELLARKITS